MVKARAFDGSLPNLRVGSGGLSKSSGPSGVVSGVQNLTGRVRILFISDVPVRITCTQRDPREVI